MHAENSPDESIHAANHAAVQKTTIHIPESAKTALLASTWTLCLVLILVCYGLWQRVTLLQIYYDDVKAALLLHGVNPHPHLPNEAP